jgi:hypothetical protein
LGLGAARRGTCYVGGLEVEADPTRRHFSLFFGLGTVDVPHARRGTRYVGQLELKAWSRFLPRICTRSRRHFSDSQLELLTPRGALELELVEERVTASDSLLSPVSSVPAA